MNLLLGEDEVPAGLIAMWSGTLATIPSGWALCDGANGTPDLRDRFIVGAAAAADPGASGGASTHGHAAHAVVVTQPNAHAVTQPNAHAVTQPNAHAVGAVAATATAAVAIGAGAASAAAQTHTHAAPTLTNNHAGAAVSAHAGAAVSAHAGADTTVDAHQDGTNTPPYFALAFIMKL